MLSIRLKRIGKRKKIFYNVIVSERLSYIKGKYIEKLGYFDPVKKYKNLKKDRIEYWVSHGAHVSKRLKNLLIN